MAKKQTSFADKASRLGKASEAVYAKYIKSVRSEKTGEWRFNEQMIRMDKGETLEAALKRLDEVANLVDIDLSQFSMETVTKNSENLKVDATEVSVDADLENKSSESDPINEETGELESAETAQEGAEVKNEAEVPMVSDEESITDEEE